jgi:hypothetical protein
MIMPASLRSDGWTAWPEHVDEFIGLRNDARRRRLCKSSCPSCPWRIGSSIELDRNHAGEGRSEVGRSLSVQDREVQHKTVEAILPEAALANAQLAVAKAVIQAEFPRKGAAAEEAAARVEEAVDSVAPRLIFGRMPTKTKAVKRRNKAEDSSGLLSKPP